jgi:hypothetical protein
MQLFIIGTPNGARMPLGRLQWLLVQVLAHRFDLS